MKRNPSEYRNLDTLAAVFQSAGRGQRGNTWKSKAGDNLTFSIFLRFGTTSDNMAELPVMQQFAISEAAALSVAEHLRRKGLKAMIKWPNDIYVGDFKICGMLIENTLRNTLLDTSVIGIGLNLNQEIFSPDIPNPTSVRILTGSQSDPKAELEDFGRIFCSYIDRIQTEEGRQTLEKEYLDILYRKDVDSPFKDLVTGEDFIGKIRGITKTALLQIELQDGSVKEFSFKELAYVTLKK